MREHEAKSAEATTDPQGRLEAIVRPIPYAVEQRLRLIDILIDHYGAAGREPLTAFFGVSPPQATRDYRLYMILNPGTVVYDSGAKRYIRGSNFSRLYA